MNDEVKLIKEALDKEELEEMVEEYGENFEKFVAVFDDAELDEEIENETGD